MYIYAECHKQNITVVSFGDDKDSRILRAIKVSSDFKLNANDQLQHDQFQFSLSSLLKELTQNSGIGSG